MTFEKNGVSNSPPTPISFCYVNSALKSLHLFTFEISTPKQVALPHLLVQIQKSHVQS